MSYFKNFMKANRAYVDLHGTHHLPLRPKTKVAIVTCMDSRLHVAQALGLALGDAHILRNAGGRITDDMLRSLVISQQQLGTREIVVLHHTDCGAQTFTNEGFAQQLARDLGVDVAGQDFLPFTDVEESVREDMAILRQSPLMSKKYIKQEFGTDFCPELFFSLFLTIAELGAIFVLIMWYKKESEDVS